MPLLCLTCNRVRPAKSPAEYTVLRAYSITTYGLCACAPPEPLSGDARKDTAVTGQGAGRRRKAGG